MTYAIAGKFVFSLVSLHSVSLVKKCSNKDVIYNNFYITCFVMYLDRSKYFSLKSYDTVSFLYLN